MILSILKTYPVIILFIDPIIYISEHKKFSFPIFWLFEAKECDFHLMFPAEIHDIFSSLKSILVL